MKIAALFVQEDGFYSKQKICDIWPEARDARLYSGSLPVVAHPPCQLWGKMAKVNYIRWGGDHNKPGNDFGCFESALNSVNKFNGVLEHPAGTYAWERYGLIKPVFGEWVKSGSGWVTEVWQSAYGHKANKKTWLYYRGERKPFDLRWVKVVGSYQIGFQDQRGKSRNKPTLSKKLANATPDQFGFELMRLALFSREEI